MPIIIWGSRGVGSTLHRGVFFCPQCNAPSEYELKDARRYFTLFFIPLFPISSGQRYVECRGCGQAFLEEILNFQRQRPAEPDDAQDEDWPDGQEEYTIQQLSADLRGGLSLERARRRLLASGKSSHEAMEMLDSLCNGIDRSCGCGERYHIQVEVCQRCGARL